MSVRRRRLWVTGAVGVMLCLIAATLLTPPAQAAATAPAGARAPAREAAVSAPPMSLDLLALRPRTALAEPGRPGAVVAHRGASEAAPENTLPAIAEAVRAGADYVEIDIRMSSDGVPVVIHDSTVDRTTDGTGSVSTLTAAEILALDAGSWFSEEYAGTRIPTLEQALGLVSGADMSIVIEYKGRWSPEAVRTTVDLLTAAALGAPVIVQSFDEKTVANIATVAPNLFVGLLTDRLDASIVATAQRIGADAVNPKSTTARGLDRAHAANLRVFVWTRDADEDWESLTAMGVDGIITNTPQALTEWIGQRGSSDQPAA